MSMSRQRHRGFTLIELIIFIVVVGAGLAGILSVFNNSIKSSADPLIRKQTMAIAESLLEEIVQKEFAKPAGSSVVGFSGGGSRTLYDCVDDYNGYTAASIVDASGTVAGPAGYSIAAPGVTVAITTIPGGGAVSVKLITVPVTGPQGVVSVTGYRGNY